MMCFFSGLPFSGLTGSALLKGRTAP
jgi:hypothetical protein